ncbi:MAG: hypothetical protein MJ252_01085 [archaeon]|nr:hypothetical protein [archaeon]
MDNTLTEYELLGTSCLSDEYLLLIKEQKERILKVLLDKTILACEINDLPKIYTFISEYYFLNKYNNVPLEDVKILLKKLGNVVEKNTINLFFNTVIIKFMSKLISIYHKNTKDIFEINWKTYFKIYEIFIHLNKSSALNLSNEKKKNYFTILTKFLGKAKRYFIFTDSEYQFLRKEIFAYIYSNKSADIAIGVELAKIFLPGKLMAEDIELQETLFKLLKTRKNFSNSVLGIFKYIMKSNQLKLDKKEFIDVFFELLMNFFSNSGNTTKKDNILSTRVKGAKAKQKYTISYAMCWIFVKICTDDFYLEPHRTLINNHLNIFVNFMNLYLGENLTNVADLICNVIVGILVCMKKILFTKTVIPLSKIQVDTRFELKDKKNEEKVKDLLNYFFPLINKCIFYYTDDGYLILDFLADLIYSLEIDKNLFTTLEELFKNNESNLYNFFYKMASMVKVFLNEKNLNNDAYSSFLNKIILACPDAISCASEEVNENILIFLTNVFILLNELSFEENVSNTKNYKMIQSTINNISVKVVEKMMMLFDFIANGSIHIYFADFIFFASSQNTPENIQKMKKILFYYPEDHIIKEDDLIVYFFICDYFQYDPEDEAMILYKGASKNLSSDITSGIKLNKEQLKYYREFFGLLDYRLIYRNAKDDIIQIIQMCLDKKEKGYVKLGVSILGKVFDCVICNTYDREKKNYDLPSQENLDYLKRLYEVFLKENVELIEKLIKDYNN